MRSIPRTMIVAACAAVYAAAAKAQPVSTCRFPTDDVPVYFNPGTLGTYGYDPIPFREALFNALALWRQQSMSRVNFYYAGDTNLVRIPNALVVKHDDTCNGRLASAFFGPGSNCGVNGAEINVHMRGGMGCTPRAWSPHWSGPLSGSGTNYEGVLVHEIGHAVFGFPDLGQQDTSVMVGNRGQVAADFHLYPEDITGAANAYGVTTRQPQTLVTNDLGNSWGTQNPFTVAGVTGAYAPALAATGNALFPLAGAVTTFQAPYLEVRQGNHGSFAGYTNPVPGASVIWHQSASAVSPFGETMVVAQRDCNRSTFCRIHWAWTNDNGANWTQGTLLPQPTIGTFSVPTVAYDALRDRFVVGYLSGNDSELYITWTFAVSPNPWSAPARARPASDSVPRPFRHLGGMVFAGNGTGLVAATAHWDEAPTIYFNSVITPITQSNLTWNSSLTPPRYELNATNYVRWYAARGEARTRVPFGLARNGSGSIVMSWRGTSGARRLMAATKSDIISSTWFNVPVESTVEAANGVTVAPGPSTSFTAGLAN